VSLSSRASHSASKKTENPKLLMKKLKISEWINKVVYTNDEINLLDDGSSQYIADAVTGSVTFQVKFVVEDMKVCSHFKFDNFTELLISQLQTYHSHKESCL
jgi:hypothetical protein